VQQATVVGHRPELLILIRQVALQSLDVGLQFAKGSTAGGGSVVSLSFARSVRSIINTRP
jgi:hypothetical protein